MTQNDGRDMWIEAGLKEIGRAGVEGVRVEVLAERLRKRNRDFERDISFEYLERVSAAYRDFFFYYDEAPLLVVDTSDIDFVANPEDLADLVREINHAGEGTQHFVPRKS